MEITDIRNQNGNIIRDLAVIKRLKKKQYEYSYADIFNLGEMEKLIERKKITKLTKEEIKI